MLMVTQLIRAFLLLRETQIHYYVNKRPRLEHILSQFNPRILILHLFKNSALMCINLTQYNTCFLLVPAKILQPLLCRPLWRF